MIKRVTRLLNNKVLLQKQYRFTSKAQGQEPVDADVQVPQEIKQQVQQNIQAVQGQQVQAGQAIVESVVEQVTVFDEFEKINLIDSNWKQIAPLVHTAFSFNKSDPTFVQSINQKLAQFQNFYGFDINNLDRLKIIENKQFQIKAKINSLSSDSSRFLELDIPQNSRIGYSLMTMRRFKQMIQNRNIPAIIQTYKNNQYKFFLIQTDFLHKIMEDVISSNFKTQYLLNYFEFYRITNRQHQIKSNKNFEKILQNINNLNDVNKLKFYWSINNIFENGLQFINYHTFSSELQKIGFQDLQGQQTEKLLKLIYNGTLGKDAIKKLINYSLNKYSTNFDQFLQFWGLFNLLITKLYSLNQTSLAHPSNLNKIFQLYELNTSQPKQIIAQIIPQVLFQTKNKSLFEIYRVHAKAWIQKKNLSKNKSSNGPYDQFINHKIEFEQPIRVVYNGWNSQNANITSCTIRTTINIQGNKNIQRKNQLLSESKMIEHLIKGDYSFVLNSFLLIFNPGLDKNSYSKLKSIIKNAKEMQFDSENTRSLYILKNISQSFKYLAEPVSFRQQFFSNFKKVRWLEKSDQLKQQRVFQKTIDDQGKFSRKEDQRFNSEQPFSFDNKQKIRSKPKRYHQGKEAKQGGALFSKKNKNLFSTQKDSYNQYRQVVKQVTQTSVDFGFNFGSHNPDLTTFHKQVQRRAKQMNQNNHKALLKQNSLPIVGNGTNLLKYLFLTKSPQNIQLDDKLKKKLSVNFISEIGALQKDYSQYLSNNRFNFPLAQQVYISLLQDQRKNYVRKTFKTIITHMIAFRTSLTQKQVQLICQICNKNRIGITLIQIYNLIIQNKISMPRQSIYNFCDTLQKFKKINNDIFLMTKKYCQNTGIDFEIKMMSSYVKNLLIEEQDEKLSDLCQMIKNQLKPKPYKLKQNITAEQNLKQQKEYKQFQKKQYNRILFEIIDMVVLNVNTKLPLFISNLFDQYEKTQLKLDAKQIAISLIVYCNNVDKFLQIIRSLKVNKQNIIPMTFQCSIKAARLNPRALESHSQQIFNVALFTHNFILTEDQIQKSVQIFKILNTPTVFIKFLEYILRYNPPVNYQIKSVMYFIMNSVNDDFAKNTISGLLDFIFNSNRQKQREQYRKAQIVEEQKIKLLQDLEKKQFFIEQLQGGTKQQVVSAQTKQTKQDKKGKKNKQDKQVKSDKQIKSDTKQASSPAATTSKQGSKTTKVAKVQRRKISLKTEQDFVGIDNQPVLKKGTMKKKLRSKSLNNFEQMFTKREQVEEVPIKGGKISGKQKQPVSDKKQKKTDKKK